jgi:hypothetical protein
VNPGLPPKRSAWRALLSRIDLTRRLIPSSSIKLLAALRPAHRKKIEKKEVRWGYQLVANF